MRFKEFLLQEATGYGISGMRSQDRIRQGKQIEYQIKNSLRKQGINIRPASSRQDMIEKIDGFWSDGKPIQIKYRDSGNDILFELIKPFNPQLPLEDQSKGRDYIGKAEYYIVLGQDKRTIFKIPTRQLKVLVDQAMRELGGQPLIRPFRSSNGVQLVPTKDPGDGTPKVNAFIPTHLFDGMSEKFAMAA